MKYYILSFYLKIDKKKNNNDKCAFLILKRALECGVNVKRDNLKKLFLFWFNKKNIAIIYHDWLFFSNKLKVLVKSSRV